VKQTKFLPRIQKQTGDSCQCNALCGLMEYLILKEYGKTVRLDPNELYERVRNSSDGREPKISETLRYTKKMGVKDSKGKFWQLKKYKHVWRPWWHNKPMLLSIDLERGEKFKDRLDKEGVMYSRIAGYHEVVMLEKIGKYLSCANSWGTKFGIDGYFFMPTILASQITHSAYKLTV